MARGKRRVQPKPVQNSNDSNIQAVIMQNNMNQTEDMNIEEAKPVNQNYDRNLVLIYNPRSPQGAEINDIYMKRMWKHEVNMVKAYPRHFANYLLEKFGFLRVVAPENLPKLKEEMTKKILLCPYCNSEYFNQKELDNHMEKTHKIDENTLNILSDVEIVSLESGTQFESFQDKIKKQRSMENLEGIPTTSMSRSAIDNDEVEWYGGGLESDQITKVDSGMMRQNIPGINKGTFGAASV